MTALGTINSATDLAPGNINGFDTQVYTKAKAALVAGANVTITANDLAQTLTIDATGSGGVTIEQVQDNLGGTTNGVSDGFLRAGSNITFAYDDTANTLTINSTGSGGGFISSIADTNTIDLT